jgi:hypothetical protein
MYLFDGPTTLLCKEPILTTFDFDDRTPPKEPGHQDLAPPPLPTPQYQGPMEVTPKLTKKGEIMHYHYKHGHISPKRIRDMAH